MHYKGHAQCEGLILWAGNLLAQCISSPSTKLSEFLRKGFRPLLSLVTGMSHPVRSKALGLPRNRERTERLLSSPSTEKGSLPTSKNAVSSSNYLLESMTIVQYVATSSFMCWTDVTHCVVAPGLYTITPLLSSIENGRDLSQLRFCPQS